MYYNLEGRVRRLESLVRNMLHRKFDKVKYFGKEYFIKGRMSSGYAVLMDIDGM